MWAILHFNLKTIYMNWVINKMDENYKSPYILDEDKNGEYLTYYSHSGETVVVDAIAEESYGLVIAKCMQLDDKDIVTDLWGVRWN